MSSSTDVNAGSGEDRSTAAISGGQPFAASQQVASALAE